MTNGKIIPITLDGILKYWPLLLLIAGIIVPFVVQQQMLNEAIHDIEVLEVKLASQEPLLLKIQITLAEISRDMVYLKERIPDNPK